MTTSNSAAAPAPSTTSDDEFQAELRSACFQEGPATMRKIQKAFQTVARDVNNSGALDDFYRRVHTASGSAGIAGLKTIHRILGAIESLLCEWKDKPDRVNPSVLRTVAQSIDFLNALFQQAIAVEHDRVPTLNVLALDDEEIALQAIEHSLRKEGLTPICVKEPAKALELVVDQQFDLVVLDIEMQGMNGLAFCSKLRTMPRYEQTPIVFVTSRTSFENRAQAILNGGDDLIAKPFLFTELALKALVLAVKSKLASGQS